MVGDTGRGSLILMEVIPVVDISALFIVNSLNHARTDLRHAKQVQVMSRLIASI